MPRIARPRYSKNWGRWYGALGEIRPSGRRKEVIAPAAVKDEADALRWFREEKVRRGIDPPTTRPPLIEIPVNPAVRGKVLMALRLATGPVTSGQMTMLGLDYPTGHALYEVLNSLVADGLVKVTTRFDEQRRRTYVLYELREFATVTR